jgi:peptide/nickel transport system permease protein
MNPNDMAIRARAVKQDRGRVLGGISQTGVLAVIGAVFLIGLVTVALAADVVSPYEPFATSIYERHTVPFAVVSHPLGTNFLGQDEFRLLLVAAKTSLAVGFLTAALAGIFGTTVGILAGYNRSWVDQLVMRLVDLQMAFPSLMLALFVLTVVGPGFTNLVAVLAISRWPVFARVARSVTLSLREREFVEAAVCLGCGPGRIMRRHIFPNLAYGQLTLGVLEVARAMLTEGGLSFLGVGIKSPDVSWGLMLAEGRGYIESAWWEVTFPGLALLLTALSLNFVANWVRMANDPFSTSRRR